MRGCHPCLKGCHRHWTRYIALLLTLCFLWPSLTWAFEQPAYLSARPQAFTLPHMNKTLVIPRKVGMISQSKVLGDKTVICIQDLHCNYEVQKNIAAIIHNLAQAGTKGVRPLLVGEEGASAPVDTSVLRDFPLKGIRRDLAEYLLKQGRITGAEYYAALGERPMQLEGIEKAGLYDASLKKVRSFLNSENQGYILDLRDLLEEVKPAIYSSSLRHFDQKCMDFREGKVTTLRQAAYLASIGKKFSLPINSYPNLSRYLELGKAAFDPSIEADKLFAEMDHLEQAIREQLYTTKAERGLDQASHRLDVMEKLLNISATQEELQAFRKHRENYRVKSIIGFLETHRAGLKARPNSPAYEATLDPAIFGLDRSLQEVDEFYQLAEERSQAFVENISARMKKTRQNLAVIITGGFHTESILKHLQEHNLGYVSIKPRLTRQDVINPYFQLLRDRETPLEKLLAKNQTLFAIQTGFGHGLDRFIQLFKQLLPNIVATRARQASMVTITGVAIVLALQGNFSEALEAVPLPSANITVGFFATTALATAALSKHKRVDQLSGYLNRLGSFFSAWFPVGRSLAFSILACFILAGCDAVAGNGPDSQAEVKQENVVQNRAAETEFALFLQGVLNRKIVFDITATGEEVAGELHLDYPGEFANLFDQLTARIQDAITENGGSIPRAQAGIIIRQMLIELQPKPKDMQVKIQALYDHINNLITYFVQHDDDWRSGRSTEDVSSQSIFEIYSNGIQLKTEEFITEAFKSRGVYPYLQEAFDYVLNKKQFNFSADKNEYFADLVRFLNLFKEGLEQTSGISPRSRFTSPTIKGWVDRVIDNYFPKWLAARISQDARWRIAQEIENKMVVGFAAPAAVLGLVGVLAGGTAAWIALPLAGIAAITGVVGGYLIFKALHSSVYNYGQQKTIDATPEKQHEIGKVLGIYYVAASIISLSVTGMLWLAFLDPTSGLGYSLVALLTYLTQFIAVSIFHQRLNIRQKKNGGDRYTSGSMKRPLNDIYDTLDAIREYPIRTQRDGEYFLVWVLSAFNSIADHSAHEIYSQDDNTKQRLIDSMSFVRQKLPEANRIMMRTTTRSLIIGALSELFTAIANLSQPQGEDELAAKIAQAISVLNQVERSFTPDFVNNLTTFIDDAKKMMASDGEDKVGAGLEAEIDRLISAHVKQGVILAEKGSPAVYESLTPDEFRSGYRAGIISKTSNGFLFFQNGKGYDDIPLEAVIKRHTSLPSTVTVYDSQGRYSGLSADEARIGYLEGILIEQGSQLKYAIGKTAAHIRAAVALQKQAERSEQEERSNAEQLLENLRQLAQTGQYTDAQGKFTSPYSNLLYQQQLPTLLAALLEKPGANLSRGVYRLQVGNITLEVRIAPGGVQVHDGEAHILLPYTTTVGERLATAMIAVERENDSVTANWLLQLVTQSKADIKTQTLGLVSTYNIQPGPYTTITVKYGPGIYDGALLNYEKFMAGINAGMIVPNETGNDFAFAPGYRTGAMMPALLRKHIQKRLPEINADLTAKIALWTRFNQDRISREQLNNNQIRRIAENLDQGDLELLLTREYRLDKTYSREFFNYALPWGALAGLLVVLGQMFLGGGMVDWSWSFLALAIGTSAGFDSGHIGAPLQNRRIGRALAIGNLAMAGLLLLLHINILFALPVFAAGWLVSHLVTNNWQEMKESALGELPEIRAALENRTRLANTALGEVMEFHPITRAIRNVMGDDNKTERRLTWKVVVGRSFAVYRAVKPGTPGDAVLNDTNAPMIVQIPLLFVMLKSKKPREPVQAMIYAVMGLIAELTIGRELRNFETHWSEEAAKEEQHLSILDYMGAAIQHLTMAAIRALGVPMAGLYTGAPAGEMLLITRAEQLKVMLAQVADVLGSRPETSLHQFLQHMVGTLGGNVPAPMGLLRLIEVQDLRAIENPVMRWQVGQIQQAIGQARAEKGATKSQVSLLHISQMLSQALHQELTAAKAQTAEQNPKAPQLLLDPAARADVTAAFNELMNIVPAVRAGGLKDLEVLLSARPLTPAQNQELGALLSSVSPQGAQAVAIGNGAGAQLEQTGGAISGQAELVPYSAAMSENGKPVAVQMVRPLVYSVIADNAAAIEAMNQANAEAPMAVIPFDGRLPELRKASGDLEGDVVHYLQPMAGLCGPQVFHPNGATAQAYYSQHEDNNQRTREQLSRTALRAIVQAERTGSGTAPGIMDSLRAAALALNSFFRESGIFHTHRELGQVDENNIEVTGDMREGGVLAFIALLERAFGDKFVLNQEQLEFIMRLHLRFFSMKSAA